MWRFALQDLITRPLRTSLAIVGLTTPIVAILGLDGRDPQRGFVRGSPWLPEVERRMIRVSGLRKVCRTGDEDVEALRGVSLEVSDAACMFIVDPSGSGKSTLLYLLGGLDSPTSGTITFDGRDLTAVGEVELDEFHRRQVGFIFQQFHLIPNLAAVGHVLIRPGDHVVEIEDGLIAGSASR